MSEEIEIKPGEYILTSIKDITNMTPEEQLIGLLNLQSVNTADSEAFTYKLAEATAKKTKLYKLGYSTETIIKLAKAGMLK